MQKRWQSIVRLLCVLIGVAILLYPSLSTYLAEKNGSRAASSYDGAVEQAKEEECRALLQAAIDYNRKLAEENETGFPPIDAQGKPVCPEEYGDLLDVLGNGMMGYIVLPTLGETIPIYHGTEEAVLQVGVGHVSNTSLPVGGASTHAALSGHRGLPTASLFTNLDQIKEGDQFYIRVLDQVLAYEVDQILTVEPNETKDLAIVEGEDYVTLITCTPYGVNSHRLLVRGTRVPYTPPADGSSLLPKEKSLTMAKVPMQYRHLLMGIAVILAFLLIRWIVRIVTEFARKRRH